MQISSRFTIAIHILTCIETFKGQYKITSDFLAGSVNANPVVIRRILQQLKAAGLVNVARGSGGAEAVIIGAGAGLSTAAGFVYSGERFEKNFSDFAEKYGFRDMYSGGFYPYDTPEEYWAYWSGYIYINRYTDAPKNTYDMLLKLVQEKDHFVITTNVDHCFQKAGFDKKRLFYTQGDFGLFQCSAPCHNETYDNENIIKAMYESRKDMRVPTELIPKCPKCGKPMSMNLRADDTFVQDGGRYAAAERYDDFLRTREGRNIVFLELGVGYNTPVIIKYPFWKMTAQNPNTFYICINKGEAFCPDEISERAVCIDSDIDHVLRLLLQKTTL